MWSVLSERQCPGPSWYYATVKPLPFHGQFLSCKYAKRNTETWLCRLNNWCRASKLSGLIPAPKRLAHSAKLFSVWSLCFWVSSWQMEMRLLEATNMDDVPKKRPYASFVNLDDSYNDGIACGVPNSWSGKRFFMALQCWILVWRGPEALEGHVLPS